MSDRHISALEDPDIEPDQLEIPLDVGDPAQVKARIKAVKLTRQRQNEVMRTFLASNDGRFWFQDYLDTCGTFRNPFLADPLLTAFNCGAAEMGRVVLLAIMEANPEAYLMMVKESQDG